MNVSVTTLHREFMSPAEMEVNARSWLSASADLRDTQEDCTCVDCQDVEHLRCLQPHNDDFFRVGSDRPAYFDAHTIASMLQDYYDSGLRPSAKLATDQWSIFFIMLLQEAQVYGNSRTDMTQVVSGGALPELLRLFSSIFFNGYLDNIPIRYVHHLPNGQMYKVMNIQPMNPYHLHILILSDFTEENNCPILNTAQERLEWLFSLIMQAAIQVLLFKMTCFSRDYDDGEPTFCSGAARKFGRPFQQIAMVIERFSMQYLGFQINTARASALYEYCLKDPKAIPSTCDMKNCDLLD